MAVVASLQFGDPPPGSASLFGKGREERSRRIPFRNAANEGTWNARLPIGRKTKRLLETSQTKITQPGAHEVTRFAWLQSPEIKLALPARQPPAISVLARDVAKIHANFRRKQVQYALPIFRNEGIQENQSLYLSWVCLCHSANDHACVTVTYKNHWVREPRQLARNVFYMLPQRNVGRQLALIRAQPTEDRCYHPMTVLFQQGDQEVPGPRRLPCAVYKDEHRHAGEFSRLTCPTFRLALTTVTSPFPVTARKPRFCESYPGS